MSASETGDRSLPTPVRRPWPDAIALRRYADLSKAMVMQQIADLVREGLADWQSIGDEAIELRLGTGEVYHLGVNAVRRVA